MTATIQGVRVLIERRTTMSTSKSLLSVNDVVAEIGVCRTMVFRLFKDGTLKSVKIGRRTFVRPDDLRAFIDAAPQRNAA